MQTDTNFIIIIIILLNGFYVNYKNYKNSHERVTQNEWATPPRKAMGGDGVPQVELHGNVIVCVWIESTRH